MAVLISSHVLAELDEVVDRAVVVSDGRTVAVETVHGDGKQDGTANRPRAWRLRAIDQEALVRALTARGLEPRQAGLDGVEIDLAGDDAAADLIAALVQEGVRLVACHPSGGVLEQAYLTLTRERR